MPQEHKIVNGRLVLTGAQQSSDLVPAVRQQPAKPPAAKPRSKPKPKPKGFFEKLSNDIRYELFNRPRPANPLQRYVGGLSRAVASSPLQGVGLGVAGVGDNAMRVGYSYAQRASGRPKADASSGRFGGHLDQTVDRVYTALGAKPPSQMTQDERSGDQFRRSVSLNVMLAPVTPGFGVARATTALGAAVRGGAAFAVNEALSTYLDDNTGGNIVNLINQFTFDPGDSKGVPFIRATRPARGVVNAAGEWTGEMQPAEKGFNLPGAVDVGKADMLDAANQSLVPNAAFGVALGAAVGGTVSLGAAAFRNIRRNTRATRAVQQETRQRAKQEAMGLLEKDEADGLDFTPQAMEPPAPAPREPSFQEANAAMEQRLGMPSNAARPEPAAAPTNVASPEPKPIPSAELQDPTNPGADMGAIYEPRQERPWDYDPELPESTALGKGIEELSDSELQIVLNSPGSPVVERVNQTLEARAQVQAPPPMDAGMVMAPADRLADDYLPSVMRKLGGREDYELRPLFDAEANPQLWQKAQALTGVDDPGQLSKADMLDTFGAMAAEGRVPIVNRMMGAQMLPTGEVQAAPLVFQYKGGVNEAGEQIGNSLSGVERWDPSAEGIIQVWRDAGGEIGDPGMVYVVNGHNRLAAAKRLGIPSMRVEYLDGPTAADARLQGAISNVSDGKGTVFDAAKLAREYDIKDPAQLKALGKPGASGFWKDGIAVGRLPEDVFTAAVNEQIPLRRAVIIGESGVDEETMRSAYRYLVQQGPDNVKEGTLREMLAMSKSSPASSSADQPDLLSGTEWAQNFNAGMLAKAEVAGAVRLLLSKEKKLFGTVGRQAGQIERVGQVDATAAKDISGEASRALAIFDDLKYQTGPVGDLLNEGTQRVLAGEQAAQVAKGIKNRLAASIQEAMGKEVAPATDVVQEDMFAAAGRQADETSQPVELTAEQRDAAEARLLQEAIAGGEVRPPNAPIPELPAPAQVRLDELDPNEPITPGSRAAQALADETRLALEHARADAALQELQEKAVKDANDYELLTFEEKKELGLTADLGKAITPEVLPAPGVRLDPNANPAQTARRLGGHNRGRGRWGITEQQWLDTFKRLGGVPDWFDLAGGSANWDKLMQGYELPQIEAKIKALVRDDSAIQTAAAAIEPPVAAVEIPAGASRKITARTSEGRIQSAAESLVSWTATPPLAPMSVDQALNLVRAKGEILDPDAIPSLDMAKAREDISMGRATPEVAAAYKQFYEFSAELPNLEGWRSVETGVGGTVGEGYTGQTRIGGDQESYLALIAAEICGPIDLRLVDRIEAVYGVNQAKAYGDISLVGRKSQPLGQLSYPKYRGEMADDIMWIAMTSYGRSLGWAKMIATTYHEAFHRLQRWFLTDGEYKVMARAEKQIRELAAKSNPSLGDEYLDGTISLKESQAEAFSGYMRGLGPAPAEGFAKIKKFVDRAISYLQTGEFKTWDDVFEKAKLGEIKSRGPLTNEQILARRRARNMAALKAGMSSREIAELGDMEVQFAADPPDPAEFARRIDQNLQALESGDLTPEEIAQMGASDVRRITSRSGNTQYVPNAPDTLIASNRALGEMLTSRAQQTGIESYSQPAVVKAAMDQLDADGWAVESTVTRLEAARRGDPKSQQDLVALAANLIHRDHIAAQNGMTAIEWQSAVDEADRAASMQRLWSGLEDQHRLDTALMTATRKDGQRLSVMQIKYDFDPTHRQVPAGTPLYHGTTEANAQSIIDNGFQASGPNSNLLGSGVYFANDPRYAGAYGEAAAAGDLPSDVRILDLVAMDKRIADLVQELNLGPLERFEENLYMTGAQKAAVRDWAVGQGYSGIRFNPDFELGEGAPETVIFDTNVANRIVGSKAAVEPEMPATAESMGTDIEGEIANPLNTILGKIDPDIRSDIEQGVMSPEATEMTEVAAQVAISSRGNPGMRAKLNSIVSKVDVGRLNQEMFLQAYRAALLWSPKTWTKMLVGSAYRAVTMPINQAIAETGTAGIAALKGDNKAAYRAMRQAGLNMGMYGKYVSNWSNAFRLVGESFRTGESFGNLGASSMDLAQRNLGQGDGQTSLFSETRDPANTLENPWWIDPENMNIPAQFAHKAWKLLSVSGRVSGSLDTFFSSLIGPSAEWSRIMGLELEKAEGRGLTGDAAWAEASKITDERIENQWVNVLLNDKTIENGAFTGIHAKAAMDWINFTDDLDVQFQPRSYEYGIAKAKEEGITDTAEINRRALAWMQEEPPIWAQRGMGVGQAVGWMPKAFKDAINHTPALGILNPFPTSPANITKAAMRATGVGAPFVDSFYRDVFSEDRNTRARAIGEIATAYMTLVGGVMLATSGFVELSGPGSYNPQTRAKMQRLGSQPYSIRFKNPATGDTTRWWDLQALDTVSNVFSLIGLQMSLNNSLPKEDREILASNFVLSVAETARQVGFAQFTKDMYKSMGEIFNLVSELQDKSFVPTEGQVDPFSGYVQRRLAGFMPAIFNNTRKGTDGYQRAIEKSELPQPFAFAHELAQRFASRIPGLSDQLPPILHPLTGEPIAIEQVWGVNYLPQDQPWLKGAVNAMSPLAFTPTKEGSKDPVDIELGRLSGRGTAFQIWGPNELGLPNFRMNQTQLNKLAVITSQFIPPGRGSTLHQGLSAMVAPGSSYWQLPPPEASKATQSARAIRINKEINYYKPFIKAEFLASEPNLARMIEENKASQAQATFDAAYGMQSSWSLTPR